jgi:hypothetical protein
MPWPAPTRWSWSSVRPTPGVSSPSTPAPRVRWWRRCGVPAAAVTAVPLDRTVVRPPGLTDRPGTGYATAEDVVAGPYCSRDDLADMLLDQLDDTRYLHRIAAVTTPGLHVDTLQTIRRELLRR